MTDAGILFHAKHAFMPNNLGYCGPDENPKILLGLEKGKSSGDFVGALRKFEAAYPFLKLIARSSGRDVFDYSVPEAYWIGNTLLHRVPVSEFYSFSHRELRGKDERQTREFFKRLDGSAVPHHTFYVMSTYAASTAAHGQGVGNESEKKLAEMIDKCRISWGRVTRVGDEDLVVLARPIRFAEGRLVMGPPVRKRVGYNPEVKPFGSVRPGDTVSLHWNYACEVLNVRQVRNIVRFTEADLSLVNRYLESMSRSGRR
jgi:hypothetical protein